MTDVGPLCCCEYYDINQERNHILACCCNCVDLDESFDSLIRGQRVPQSKKQRLMATLRDRVRIPWHGGAKQIAFDAVLPIFILPIVLLVAAISLWWTIFAFTTITVFLAYIFHCFISTIPRTKFFFVWTITSIVILYAVFEFMVIPLLAILLEENIALSILIGAYLLCLYLIKVRHNRLYNFEDQVEKGNLGMSASRYHNCSICQTTVPDKDHHCVWYDCCIGQHNQGLFILSLIFAIAALLYSSNLTLTSICHPFKFYKTILLPDDCSEVYEDYELGICFVTALYSIAIATILFIMLLHQIILISIGLTRKEWKSLPLYAKCLLGFPGERLQNKGFFSNWRRIFCWRD